MNGMLCTMHWTLDTGYWTLGTMDCASVRWTLGSQSTGDGKLPLLPLKPTKCHTTFTKFTKTVQKCPLVEVWD